MAQRTKVMIKGAEVRVITVQASSIGFIVTVITGCLGPKEDVRSIAREHGLPELVRRATVSVADRYVGKRITQHQGSEIKEIVQRWIYLAQRAGFSELGSYEG